MTTQPNFAVIGVAGFIAPRHLRAIKEVDGRLTVRIRRRPRVRRVDGVAVG